MQVVAPYGGVLEKTGDRQVTIKIDEMKDMIVVIDNIDLTIAKPRVSLNLIQFPLCSTSLFMLMVVDVFVLLTGQSGKTTQLT